MAYTIVNGKHTKLIENPTKNKSLLDYPSEAEEQHRQEEMEKKKKNKTIQG